MILDLQLLCDDARALSGMIVGNNVSTNPIDLWGSTSAPAIPQGGTVLKDVARASTQLDLFCQIGTTATSGGAATMQVQLIGATASDLTTGQIVYTETAATLALATLVSGYRFRLQLPPGGITLRYLGFRYVVGTAVYTGGTITSGIILTSQTNLFVG